MLHMVKNSSLGALVCQEFRVVKELVEVDFLDNLELRHEAGFHVFIALYVILEVHNGTRSDLGALCLQDHIDQVLDETVSRRCHIGRNLGTISLDEALRQFYVLLSKAEEVDFKWLAIRA